MGLGEGRIELAQARCAIRFAKSAWDDSGRVERPDTRSDYGEPRCISFARIGVRVYVITHTQREGRTRIISARKANSRETRNYEICQVHS